mgnify:CR=1 FL=1
MLEHAAGDAEHVKEMITIYNNEMPIYLNDLNMFAAEQNWKEVSRQAHKIKSPAAVFGLLKLKTILNEIEADAKSNIDSTRLNELIKTANSLCLVSIEELKLELAKL